MKEVNRSGNLATVLMLTPATLWFLFLLALPLVVVFVFSFGERARRAALLMAICVIEVS